MKATGILRRIDDLGRVVIPKEIRRTFGIKEGDALEISTIEGGIVLSKYNDEENKSAQASEFVAINASKIACVIPNGDETFVKFVNGRGVTVKRDPNDKYDLSVAILYAFKKVYPEALINGDYPNWM